MPALQDRKAYFILGTADYGPSHIELGQIITDFEQPYRALSSPLNTSATPLPTVQQGLLRAPYTLKLSKEKSGALGIQTQLLTMLGSPLSADTELSCTRGDVSEWVFDRLETVFIEPSQKYVEDSVMLVPEVKNWLEKRKLRGAVYMVTGIKIARGARYTKAKVRALGLGGALTADLAVVTGAPSLLGPTGEIERREESVESYDSRADFVWAYRVQRIYVQWFNGNVKSKEKVGGDLAGVGEGYKLDLHIMDASDDEGYEIGEVLLDHEFGLEMVPDDFTEAEDAQGNLCGDYEDFLVRED